MPCLLAQVPGYTISDLAGFSFYQGPVALAFDSAGNLYSANFNHLILKTTPTGTTTTVAGGGTTTAGLVGDGGTATNASLLYPSGITLDSAGNIYIADTGHNRIRKVSTTGSISTVAGPGSTNGTLGDGGPATSATLSVPDSVILDATGNLYIADTGHNRIRKVSLDGTISTVAGSGSGSGALGDGGPAINASLSVPTGIVLDPQGNLYIADSGHYRIRMVTANGTIQTIAGNGSDVFTGDGGLATLASVGGTQSGNVGYLSAGLALDATGNIYVADVGHIRVRMISTDGRINTIAGTGTDNLAASGGPATNAAINYPRGVISGPGGIVYVADGVTIRVLTPTGTPVYPGPSFELNGVVNASAFGPTAQLALGSWVEIHGSYLAPDSRSWAGGDFNGTNAPTSLDGTSVTIGGQPAFISYISPGQINAQVPTMIGTGSQQLVVTTSHGSTAAYVATVNGVQPRLLAPASFAINSVQYAVALFSDGTTYALPKGAIAGVPSQPATAGDTITLYGIGFGSVTPSIGAGQITPASNSLDLPFTVKVGAMTATVLYAGLAPGTVGLYQFNIVVPKLNVTGNVAISFTLGGVAGSQTLYLPVQ